MSSSTAQTIMHMCGVAGGMYCGLGHPLREHKILALLRALIVHMYMHPAPHECMGCTYKHDAYDNHMT